MPDQPDVDDMDAQGFFYDVPFADYLSWPALSKSRIDVMRELTPMHFKHALENEENLDTEVFADGRAFHAAILEPESFCDTYITAPPPPDGEKWDRRKKAHKDAWAEFEATTAGKTILTTQQRDMYMAMADAVTDHPLAGRLVEAAHKEVSMRWRDVDTGLMLKGRLDGFIPELGNFIIDPKSTQCAAPRRFWKSVANFGYYIQMAMYYDGVKQLTGEEVRMPVLIACEKAAPYGVAVHQFTPEVLAIGRDDYKLLLMDIKHCQETGVWPGYDQDFIAIELPDWVGFHLRSYEIDYSTQEVPNE